MFRFVLLYLLAQFKLTCIYGLRDTERERQEGIFVSLQRPNIGHTEYGGLVSVSAKLQEVGGELV